MDNKSLFITIAVIVVLFTIFGLYVWGSGKDCGLENEKLAKYALPIILTHDELDSEYKHCMERHGL